MEVARQRKHRQAAVLDLGQLHPQGQNLGITDKSANSDLHPREVLLAHTERVKAVVARNAGALNRCVHRRQANNDLEETGPEENLAERALKRISCKKQDCISSTTVSFNKLTNKLTKRT